MQIAEGTYVLSFRRDFHFRAGQVVAIDLAEQGEPRLYSIASGENDTHIDILFEEKPDGKLTPRLSSLKAGDTIYVSAPFGHFHCPSHETAWWIAAGTGVAPFVSMIRSGMGTGKRLIHGGKSDKHFYFAETIHPTLQADYIRCASRQADTQYYPGRLTTWLNEQTALPTEIKYYLCGSAEMVVEVRDILIGKGVPFRHIISETYFYPPNKKNKASETWTINKTSSG